MYTRLTARLGASRQWFLLFAEPDIHLLPQAVVGRRRGLSLCSLPVPKQFGGSLRSLQVHRSVGHLQDLAACALCNPVFPTEWAVKPLRCCVSLPAQMADSRDPPRANTSPSCERPQSSLDLHCLSLWLFRTPTRVHGFAWVPASQLPPRHAEYVCCVVWKEVFVTSSQRSSFRRRTIRSS